MAQLNCFTIFIEQEVLFCFSNPLIWIFTINVSTSPYLEILKCSDSESWLIMFIETSEEHMPFRSGLDLFRKMYWFWSTHRIFLRLQSLLAISHIFQIKSRCLLIFLWRGYFYFHRCHTWSSELMQAWELSILIQMLSLLESIRRIPENEKGKRRTLSEEHQERVENNLSEDSWLYSNVHLSRRLAHFQDNQVVLFIC